MINSYNLINKCNFPSSLKESFYIIVAVYPIPEKRLKLIDKLTAHQLSGVVSNHLMGVARKCQIPSVYIEKFLGLKKDLARKKYSKYKCDGFWKSYIEKAEKELPGETRNLLQAVKASKIFKKRLHNLERIRKQESVNKKLKKVKES